MKLAATKEMFDAISKPYISEVEYLKSTGTQWIDTEIKSSGEIEVEIALHTQYIGFISGNCYYVFGYDPYFIGQTSRESCFHIGGGTQGSAARNCVYGGETYYQANYPWPNEKTTAMFKDLKFSIGGTQHYSWSSKKTFVGGNCFLFASNQPGTSPQVSNPNMKCYSCKIWESKVLVRDFIPVTIKGENDTIEGAMYDKVSKRIFRNAGSGRFEIGPDIS